MTRIAAFVLAALVSFTYGCAHPGTSRDPVDSAKALLRLHEQWAAARVNGDVAFLERFYGQELRLNQADGGVVERNDDIALFDRAGKLAARLASERARAGQVKYKVTRKIRNR